MENWQQVIFSDESKFVIGYGDQGPRVRRKKWEKYRADCLKSVSNILHPWWFGVAGLLVGLEISVSSNRGKQSIQKITSTSWKLTLSHPLMTFVLRWENNLSAGSGTGAQFKEDKRVLPPAQHRGSGMARKFARSERHQICVAINETTYPRASSEDTGLVED